MLATLALMAATIGFSVWHYLRRPYALQLCTWFNACAMAYMGFGMALAREFVGHQYEIELDQIAWMCVAAVIGFNVAYMIANFRSVPGSRHVSEYLPSYTSVFLLLVVGLTFEAVAVLLIGPLDFLLSDRVERFADMKAHQALFYMANLMNVCLPLTLARYLSYGQRRDLTMLCVLLAHGVLLALFTISRYDLALVMIIGGYYLERRYTIHPVAILLCTTVAFVVTLFFKPVLYGLLLERTYDVDIDFGEYYNWIRHTLMLMSNPDVELPHGGYILALKSLFVVRPEQDSLAEWFFQEFYPERVILFPGLGYGFSGVWEGYTSNGMIGVAMHFAIFGALFGLLERHPSALRHVLIVFAMVLTYRLFRSEAYNFVKTFAWYFVYPVLAIVVFDKFLTWASRTSAVTTPKPPATPDEHAP